MVNWESNLIIEIIKDNILKIMPDLVVTHSRNDYHSDHRSLSLLTNNAVSHYIPILYCDTLMGVNFNPNFYFDITDYYSLKEEAILKHKTQKPQRFVDLFKLMNSYRVKLSVMLQKVDMLKRIPLNLHSLSLI